MSEGQRSTLLAFLRRLARCPESESSDAVLLDRFAEAQDDSAFTSLLRRHGPLVWGVCRRVLADEHAAEDAFQATFLVLVRKASSLRKKASLRSWLYGVALRVAVRARQRQNLRRLREQNAPIRQTSDSRTEADWQEVRTILDEEIQRLPEKYRLPILLCYLEGRTNDEAAKILSCPRGTIATRLARGRERLRLRLIRRGLTLSVGTLATMFADNALLTAAPSLLIAQTAKVVLTGTMPVSITTLTEGVLHAMFLAKMKTTIAVIIALSVMGSAGICTYYLHGQEEPDPKKFVENAFRRTTPDKIAPAKPAEALRKLLKERRDWAEQEAKEYYAKYRAGAQDALLILTINSSKHLLKAELELSAKKADRLVGLERHARLMKEIAEIVEAKYKVERVSLADHALAQYERLDAEIALEREKAR